LKLGDGEIFHEEHIGTSIEKIRIDLAELPQIQDLKRKSCESFFVNIKLGLPGSTFRGCRKAFTETFYNRNETRRGLGEFNRRSRQCQVNLGAWEYNLLNSWVEAYSKEMIRPSYGNNSIVINMGPANEFSWCGLSRQKISMKLTVGDTDSPNYCKQLTDLDFNPLEGKVRIDSEAFTNCNQTNYDLDPESFQCVDWEDIEMTISLHLDQCHRNLIGIAMPNSLENVYKSACDEHDDTCIWKQIKKKKNPYQQGPIIGSSKPFDYVFQCVEKSNNSVPSTIILFNNVQPLNATKATGTISTREEEDTGMIFLSDSEDNLECLKKQFEIRSLVPNASIKPMLFNENYSIPKSELYPDDCLEHVKTISLETLSKQTPDFYETFESFSAGLGCEG